MDVKPKRSGVIPAIIGIGGIIVLGAVLLFLFIIPSVSQRSFGTVRDDVQTKINEKDEVFTQTNDIITRSRRFLSQKCNALGEASVLQEELNAVKEEYNTTDSNLADLLEEIDERGFKDLLDQEYKEIQQRLDMSKENISRFAELNIKFNALDCDE